MSTTTIFRDAGGREYRSYTLPVLCAKWGMFWLGRLGHEFRHVEITKVGAGRSSGKPVLVGRFCDHLEHIQFDQVTGLSVSPRGYRIEKEDLNKLLTALNRPPPPRGDSEVIDMRSTF